MAKVWKYKNKRTKQYRYAFKLYLGKDPATGRYLQTTRRGFDSSKEAKLAADQLKIAFQNGEYKHEQPKTFDELYHIWFDQYQKNVKESTLSYVIGTYKNQIKPFLGDKYLDHITPFYCQKMIDSWSKKYRLFGHYRALTKQIFDFGVRMEMCKANPIKKTTLPKNHFEKRQSNFYDREELKEFLECVKKSMDIKAYTAFWLLAFTGMRKSEMLALTWADIDFDNKILEISKTVSVNRDHSKTIIEKPKTKNSIRIVSIDDRTIEKLKEWKLVQTQRLFKKGIRLGDNQQLVIPNIYNAPFQPPHFNRYLYDIYKKYPGLKRITVHGFRHTHASLLFESGATIKEVQERLGHKDIKTTMNIYTHVTKKTRKNVADNFAKFMDF
ncbi:MAG: site-specific integrase [Liquorilactobacillus nagelii]|jgi:integrase|uniref:site-specific integrase n=1 Tax=Liquorilactobacillus nagelii TaxID=82688 RepID=UPI00242E6A5E|nr:site-specific integrase [Liquorilactobacillus nagelii]MCI1921931.1 site-specific integrase [Liquorilactobacillus nagelii]MCI1976421.1 site-specific integrase [Liquorilactobacillus nagelii]